MSGPSSVLVVGASAAGLATVEALRRRGFTGGLTVLGDEQHPPYDRPPLSKQVLSGAWPADRARLRTAEALDALDARFVPGDAAVSLDVAARAVRTASGLVSTADAVVVATGARPRRLPADPGPCRVHVLRTMSDALALRADLLVAQRLVVVGDGVLGAEVAATACGLGVDVTLVGPQPAPLALQLGPLASGALAALHAERGVRLRLGVGVDRLVGDGVRLADGEVVPADVVVVAVGAVPNTEWLAGSGLVLDNGVVCDARCRAAQGVYAVGDVARWQHPTLGPLRLENRTNATEQAAVVAENVLGAQRTYAPVPYFWTDQFDARIQVHGVPAAATRVTLVEGDVEARRFVALYEREGAAVAVLGWNMPKQARQHRRQHLEEPPVAGA
ncbi:FAD-dependent oxidoreductase [Actinosynnema sp. NPDC047251]|uniref:NAD(P)H-nitrite reductase n=1 Tax=Saccharothrix espanaensis (strain ATCC 51144 / DSM 44229 / JCM 9112 / NBRC 15066 / NRRL 15764) TaxID=1179773 RepID=K0JYC9_SACES|nr:FAD-dependent oxidoreductase [Saccharothrix espanaensis]CCH31126.1 NAD(P)H-nitrite reductase [Saccharothrix espanaensis DSM 44229]